jgi:two-component system NtrC family sensor kinase
MAVPQFQSDTPGLRVLAEVAGILAAGLGGEDALAAAAGALRRGLALRYCRVWLRDPDGAGFHAIGSGGADDPTPPPFAPASAEWFRGGVDRETTAAGELLRLPLVHDEQALGALELMFPPGRLGAEGYDVAVVVARILAPLIATTELSQDLASEVALRTREVEAQRNFAARIIDSLPVGLYVIDRSYVIRAWNRKRESGTQGVSREDAVGREVFDILDRQPRDLLKREFDGVFDTGEIQQVEMESSASGEPRYYRITKIPMRLDDEHIAHVITIGEDVTEWRQAQQRLAQTEKLAAVGQLAAGVMHEINNPLATISACAEALAHRTGQLPPADRQSSEEYLRIIDTEVQRCRRIVDGLLDFSRPRTGEKRDVEINAVIDQTLFLLKHHDRFKRMTVARELGSGLPPLKADPERLIQAFMALMLNAMDAMNTRGVLTVRSRRNPERGDELLIEFIDTGVGIRQEELSKIFEPFFTTKPQGRGTGLGLSVCYGIVADHRGRIEVESQIGVGSNFKVFLPLG